MSLQRVLVSQRILSLPPPDSAISLSLVLLGLSIGTQQWAISCIAGCNYLPENFGEIAALLEQAAAATLVTKATFADLLALRQGDGSFEAHANQFCALARQVTAPEAVLPQLFLALLLATSRLVLTAMEPRSTLDKELALARATIG